MKLHFILTCFVFFSALQARCCDTLFSALKFKSYRTARIQDLRIDTSFGIYYLSKPDLCIFWSKEKDPAGYCVAVPDGKKWKYWNLGIDPNYLDVDHTWYNVNGTGKPELILFIHDYFGHHAATHMEETKSYSIQVWNVETTTLLLDYTYRSYEQNLDVDLGGASDSLGNPWPPEADEYYHLDLYPGKLFIFDSCNVKIPVFHSQSEVDSMKVRPAIWQIAECPQTSGVYLLRKNSWVRTQNMTEPADKPISPPAFFTYWEKFFIPDK